MTFKELGLTEPLLKALERLDYHTPTPIQQQAIPIILSGQDLLGCAQTGTGKTAAFAIPIIERILAKNEKNSHIKVLVVTPTRELAIQIEESFKDYTQFTDLRTLVIFGGVKQGKQTDALRKRPDILVATPGRLLDLMNQGFISLKDVQYAVLDEADQMLDMGFIHDIKKLIAKLPSNRQSLFFSATMPQSIVDLSSKILGNPQRITIKPEQATAEKVTQELYFVSKGDKINLLAKLVNESDAAAVLVFSRTKHGANNIVKKLEKFDIKGAAIHGNKSQAARQNALEGFKDGKLKVLVATDIAARGIDIDQLSLVINYDLPNVPETYVHRIGRTGRASASGVAISFCDGSERPYLRDIEKLIRQKVPVISGHEFEDDGTEVIENEDRSSRSNRSNRSNTKPQQSSGGKKKEWKPFRGNRNS
jgi:ATP-dependent RNA helicase RhlE